MRNTMVQSPCPYINPAKKETRPKQTQTSINTHPHHHHHHVYCEYPCQCNKAIGQISTNQTNCITRDYINWHPRNTCLLAENVTEHVWREQRLMALKDLPELETKEQYIRCFLGGGNSVLTDHQYSQTKNSNTTDGTTPPLKSKLRNNSQRKTNLMVQVHHLPMLEIVFNWTCVNTLQVFRSPSSSINPNPLVTGASIRQPEKEHHHQRPSTLTLIPIPNRTMT